MTDTMYKNFRNKVGKDISRSSTVPLLQMDEGSPPPSPVKDPTKTENVPAESEKVDKVEEISISKEGRGSLPTQTPYRNLQGKPEPMKRKSISTESPTVYIEVETSPLPWKLKTKDKLRKGNAGSLSTIPSGEEQQSNKEVGGDDSEAEIQDWCHLGPLKEAIAISMSLFYGIFIMVLGVVVPIAETFAGKRNPDVFELYYIYLYGLSIIFLVFLNWDRLLCRSNSSTCGRRISTLRSVSSKQTYCQSDADDNQRPNDSDYDGGSFYLRISAMVFGIGSMVHSGLHFGQYFQVFDGDKLCHHIALAIKPFMHVLFTFSQLYFIFMHFKMNINKNKTVTRFGLIHMCGTNVCVWFRVIVIQTINIIRIGESLYTPVTSPVVKTTPSPLGMENSSHFNGRKLNMFNNGTYNLQQRELFLPEVSCYWYNFMGNVLESADPYLYPCMIQYSFLCTGILYSMWRGVSQLKMSKIKKTSRSSFRLGTATTTTATKENGDDENDTTKGRMNSSKSSRGLFLGILISVGAIITMIAFHVLSGRMPMDGKAIILVHLSETALYVIMTLAVILAAERMKTLGFRRGYTTRIENKMLFVSFTGLLTFALFSVLSAMFETDKPHGVLTILTNLFMIVQAVLQTLFLLAGEKMVVKNKEQENKKNGREIVIFLLMCNFSMWAMNTFETQRPEHNPLQLKFYNILAWSVITYITVPLGLFYRFHSALLLGSIWKNTWKAKSS